MQYPHAPGVSAQPTPAFIDTGDVALCERHDESRPAPQRPLRVVVAEDNRDAADTLRMLLEIAGHQVWIAETGPAAVETVRRQAPDVLLCDIGLPGMSGYEVARTLRQDARFCRLPMFACTGYSDPAHRAAASAAGFDRHFSKGNGPLAMLAEVDRLGANGAIEGRAR